VAWDALVFAESLGATFGGFGLTLGSAAGASAMVLTVELAYQETVDNLGACAE
jgi:Na+/H+ antiporter NhaD/arsenite permease-like protein